MDVTLAIKVRLYPDEAAAAAFTETAKQYALACNYVSRLAFDMNCCNAMDLQKACYNDIRSAYGLPAQMAVSVTRTVAARYAAIKTQMKQNRVKFKCEGKTYAYKRTLEHLLKPVNFARPQADLVRGRNYSFVKDRSTLSIGVLGGRVKVPFCCHGFDKAWADVIAVRCKLGGAKLIKSRNKWYLHIGLTYAVSEPALTGMIVGIDRGIINTAVYSNTDGNTTYVSGDAIMEKRDKYARIRSSLQAKGTKGAKRVLKRISGRENRWMNDVNHCLSKTLANEYDAGTLFVLEDLTGVSFEETNLHGKEDSREKRSWAFYDLERKLTYKAAMNGSLVIKVEPEYTSQRCPVCGRIDKTARDREKHMYTCPECGYADNDDKTASLNLIELGMRYMNGEEKPCFKIV